MSAAAAAPASGLLFSPLGTTVVCVRGCSYRHTFAPNAELSRTPLDEHQQKCKHAKKALWLRAKHEAEEAARVAEEKRRQAEEMRHALHLDDPMDGTAAKEEEIVEPVAVKSEPSAPQPPAVFSLSSRTQVITIDDDEEGDEEKEAEVQHQVAETEPEQHAEKEQIAEPAAPERQDAKEEDTDMEHDDTPAAAAAASSSSSSSIPIRRSTRARSQAPSLAYEVAIEGPSPHVDALVRVTHYRPRSLNVRALSARARKEWRAVPGLAWRNGAGVSIRVFEFKGKHWVEWDELHLRGVDAGLFPAELPRNQAYIDDRDRSASTRFLLHFRDNHDSFSSTERIANNGIPYLSLFDQVWLVDDVAFVAADAIYSTLMQQPYLSLEEYNARSAAYWSLDDALDAVTTAQPIHQSQRRQQWTPSKGPPRP